MRFLKEDRASDKDDLVLIFPSGIVASPVSNNPAPRAVQFGLGAGGMAVSGK